MELELAVFVLPLLFGAQGTPGSGATPVCNDLTRTLQQPAGISGEVASTDCAQISVSVGALSFSTPPSCIVAYTQYCESVFSCGPSAEGISCDPRGNKATIKNHSNGRCPDVSGLANGMSWEKWEDVPSNLVAIIEGLSSCVLPEVSETFDWSATVSSCAEELAMDPSVLQETSGALRTAGWSGDPRSLVEGGPVRNPFDTAYAAAMRKGGGTSEPLLQEVEAHHPSLPGAEVSVALEVRHYGADRDEASHVTALHYEGVISAGGAFDLVRTSILQGPETLLRRERQLFDGVFLVLGTRGSTEARVLGPLTQAQWSVWTVELLPYLGPLHRWLDNPFDLSRFSAHRYSVADEDGGGRVVLEKMAAVDGHSYADRRLALARDEADGPLHVRESWVLDAQGNVRERSSFGDFRRIGSGIWRPFRIERTLFLDPLRPNARVEWAYRFESAEPLHPARIERIPKTPLDPADSWLVWP